MTGAVATTPKTSAARTGQQSLFEALASLDGVLRGGMSSSLRAPSSAAADSAASLRLKATIDRYFQF